MGFLYTVHGGISLFVRQLHGKTGIRLPMVRKPDGPPTINPMAQWSVDPIVLRLRGHSVLYGLMILTVNSAAR